MLTWACRAQSDSDAGERDPEGGSGCCNVGLEREGARKGAREGRVSIARKISRFQDSRILHLFAHLCTLSTPSSLPTCHAPPSVQCSNTRTQTCIQQKSRCLSKLLGLISSPYSTPHAHPQEKYYHTRRPFPLPLPAPTQYNDHLPFLFPSLAPPSTYNPTSSAWT